MKLTKLSETLTLRGQAGPESFQRSYAITIEAGKYSFVTEDEDDRPYYVSLFLGDLNRPHKPGTLASVGLGWTMDEVFDKAVADLHHPTTKKKVNQKS